MTQPSKTSNVVPIGAAGSREKGGKNSAPSGPRATQDAVTAGVLQADAFVGRTGQSVASRESIERARAGDPRELQAIARAELPKVERMLRKLLGHRSDMEDLVQNVFVEMCRSLPTFRGDSSISTFVGGITVHVARRAMRPTAWYRFRSPMPEEAPPGPDRPDANAVVSEQLRRLHAALSKISADKRIAFVLWAMDGKDDETVAEMVGASVAATRSRIHYAQKELKVLAAKDPYLRELLPGDSDVG